MKNKIGWCDMTWNPVWGCNNHCEYGYARGIAKRFGGIMVENEIYHLDIGNKIVEERKKRMNDFLPMFLESQFDKKFPKKPQRIFVGSMSEINHWEKRWVRDTLDKILEYPQHAFQFLTKFPDIYSQWYFHPNCWLGITITKEEDFAKGIPYDFIYSKNITFLSIEPILERIDPNLFSELNINMVILGAETGNRKGKVIPEKQWIWDIINYCQTNNIPIYVKDSIIKLYSQFGGIKEFPEEKR